MRAMQCATKGKESASRLAKSRSDFLSGLRKKSPRRPLGEWRARMSRVIILSVSVSQRERERQRADCETRGSEGRQLYGRCNQPNRSQERIAAALHHHWKTIPASQPASQLSSSNRTNSSSSPSLAQLSPFSPFSPLLSSACASTS